MEVSRITAVNDAPFRRGGHRGRARGRGDFVLYWMIAARRTTYSHALDHAIARAIELDRPLLVLEPLRAGYRWASDRLHAFVLQGMADNAAALAAAGITYLPYVEPEPELGHGFCFHRRDYRWSSLPDWAQKTLDAHAGDPRPHLYTRRQLERAETHDPIWNAAQRQLLGEGRIHNYLRMLWGKKILEWSPSPRAALATLIELNNKHAVDGRDPNSYSGIFWTLGRFDRPWGPERPIFGTVRYMSSDATRRKLDLTAYLRRWGGDGAAAMHAP